MAGLGWAGCGPALDSRICCATLAEDTSGPRKKVCGAAIGRGCVEQGSEGPITRNRFQLGHILDVVHLGGRKHFNFSATTDDSSAKLNLVRCFTLDEPLGVVRLLTELV